VINMADITLSKTITAQASAPPTPVGATAIVITIQDIKVEEAITKDLKRIPNITTRTKRGTESPSPGKIVDIGKYEDTFIITGHITNGKQGATSITAKQHKDNFRYITTYGGTVTLTYAGDTYEVNFDKVQITENRQENPSDTNKVYDVIMTLRIGTDR